MTGYGEPTEEQRAAIAAAEEAIRNLIDAYDDNPGLLMEWVVVTAEHQTHDDGTGSTAVGHWASDDLPHYRALGLLDYARTRLAACIAGNADLDR